MPKWWSWWLKWWVWVGAGIFIVILFSQPPQLWFWLVIFVVVLLYGLERTINLLVQYRENADDTEQSDKKLTRK